MNELTETEARFLLCEHDENLVFNISLSDSEKLYNAICDYLDVLKTGDIELIEKRSIFGAGDNAVFYYYYESGWEIVSELNGVPQIMNEMSKQNEIWIVSIENFHGVN